MLTVELCCGRIGTTGEQPYWAEETRMTPASEGSGGMELTPSTPKGDEMYGD